MRLVIGLLCAAAAVAAASPSLKGSVQKDTTISDAVRAAMAAGGALTLDAKKAAIRATRERVRGKFANGSDTVDVQTPFGGLRGFITDSGKSQHFLGIPFAEPPVGPRRWQPPSGPKYWNGTIEADWFGNACPQSFGVMTVGTSISEDCLYLNVYRPNKPAPAGGFPVMVFIYGGSWKEGSDDFFLYWADNDIALVEDVIMVTINYRLSAFGFLASEALRAQDPEGTTGNYGFQDQRAALKWAIQAAPSFGGNPKNVMLFGESAGAGSTSCHLVSERSKGLFQRAAMESGPFTVWDAIPLNISEAKYARVASYLGCASGDVSDPATVRAISDDKAVLDCLRTKNMSDLLEAGDHASRGVVSVDWAPTVDGVELTDQPRHLAAAGKMHDVPTLLGTNMDEGTEFSKAPHDLNQTGYLPYLEQRFSKPIADRVAPLYPPEDYPSPWWAETHIIGDGLMSCAARRSSRWMMAAPGRTSPVFLYYFQHVFEVVKLFVPYKGCFHGSELALVFDFKLALWTDEEKALADNVVRYWSRFATAGNPNGGSDTHWPAYDTAQDEVLVLDVGPLKTLANLKKEVCDVWDTIYIDPSLVFGN